MWPQQEANVPEGRLEQNPPVVENESEEVEPPGCKEDVGHQVSPAPLVGQPLIRPSVASPSNLQP